jgi:cobalamin-dependent methionine synthase I
MTRKRFVQEGQSNMPPSSIRDRIAVRQWGHVRKVCSNIPAPPNGDRIEVYGSEGQRKKVPFNSLNV